MLLNTQWVTEEIKGEIKKCLETNDNENTSIQNLWDSAKAVLRGKSIAIPAYFKKQEKSQKKKPQKTPKQSNFTPNVTRERRTNKTQTQCNRRKEIIKIRAEINEIEMKKTIEKINETNRWSFEKKNKIDKSLARLIKKKRERTQINKI